MRVLVTGGCGFIGSHFVRLLMQEHPDAEVVNLDKMTYAASEANVAEVADDPRYSFVRGDIGDRETAAKAVHGCTHVANFAAESHVDRSIHGAADFITTDVLGTYVLMEAALDAGVQRFLQVSTDEVYGSTTGRPFTETDPLQPSSPYSASKAGGDLQVLAYSHTHGLPVVITRGSNTYGPNQYPEKLIPLFITNALEGESLPVYGTGDQVRDWIHARDHAAGVLHALLHGETGEVYNVGGGNERENLWITEQILELTGASRDLITHVSDRPGHDFRYALDTTKLRGIGWEPKIGFAEGLAQTVQWFQDNRAWWEPIKSGEFRDFYEQQYGSRLAGSAADVELRAPGRVAEQLLYTHRGGGKGSGLFENTVRGVQDARAAGVDGIEFDVRRTADGVLVVNHDAHLGPIRNPDWVARNTYADLKAAKPQLATFREILDAAQGMRLDIERKGGGHTAQFLQELHDAGVDPARTVITSFNHRAIREVHELEPTWTTGLLLEPLKAAPWLRTERGAEWTAARAAAMGASFLAPHVSSFDAVAKAAEGHGLLLVPWTVTEKADFERLAAHPQTAGLIVDDSRWAVALRAGLDAPEHGGTALAPAVGAAPSR